MSTLLQSFQLFYKMCFTWLHTKSMAPQNPMLQLFSKHTFLFLQHKTTPAQMANTVLGKTVSPYSI